MMAAGHAVLIWALASGLICILLLMWTAIVGLGTAGSTDGGTGGRACAFALCLIGLAALLAMLPSGLVHLLPTLALPYAPSLVIGASLCLFAAIVVLLKLRKRPDVRASADLGIAACLNLWLALLVLLTPLSTL
jgi:hypothetical protein